jgi:hypothetical protein
VHRAREVAVKLPAKPPVYAQKHWRESRWLRLVANVYLAVGVVSFLVLIGLLAATLR